MLNTVSSNRGYAIGVGVSLFSALVLVVTVLAQAVDRTQAFV